MLKIALTGGIATGKSYVLDQFRRARRAVPRRRRARARRDRGRHRSDGARSPRGSAQTYWRRTARVDRQKLGPIVFADAAARRDSKQSCTRRLPRRRRRPPRVRAGRRRAGGCSIPLLYETGGEKGFDRVIVTACGEDVQVARLAQRGLSEAAARQRIAAQWSTAAKTARADFVITTDGTFAETDAQVADVLKALAI